MHFPQVSPSPSRKLLLGEHLLRELIQEHETLLGRLQELDQLIEDYREAAGTPDGRDVTARIGTIADAIP